MADEAEVSARIAPGSLRLLIQNSRTWDAASRREMRKGLRRAAETASAGAQAEVLGPPPQQAGQVRRHQTRGLRRGLAAGVKVSIRSGRETADGVKGEGVRVTTTAAKLPPEQAAMVKAYMARSWRHPVFGGRRWVEQRGKDWFFNPLMRHREEYQRAIVAAIEAAISEMERQG
jgi:hypothetical protein